LTLDHPFIPEGRFASLLVRDGELAERLADGFQKLWSKAMHDLRGNRLSPRGLRGKKNMWRVDRSHLFGPVLKYDYRNYEGQKHK
jgi:hypothetical protein